MDEAINFWNNFASTSGSFLNDILPLAWLIIGAFIVFWIFAGIAKGAKIGTGQRR